MFWYLLCIIIFLCIVDVVFNHNTRARVIKKIPGPKDRFLVGNGLELLQPPIRLMQMLRECAEKWNGIYRFWIYPFGAIFIYNPHDIELIMSGMKYNEKSVIYSLLRPWLGDGLLLSKGKKWHERRKILTPAFHFNILKQFCEIIEENTTRFVECLKQNTGKSIDVTPIISEFTLSTICETSMGTKLYEGTTAKSYKKAIYDLGSLFIERLIRVYLYADFVFNLTSINRAQNRNLKVLHNFTEDIIVQRKEYLEKNGSNIADHINVDDDYYVYSKKKKTALIDLLISAEKDNLIDREGIQEEVDTFMFEGHDTIASALTFCYMLLANHKSVQDNIFEELIQNLPDTNSSIKIEDLSQLKYMECCIKESLRLYPPVHFVSRQINEATILSNYEVPAGAICHIPIIDLHHRADLFPSPDQFKPERFFPENCLGRHPYAYIPFSAGPRNCIGQKFAMMEMKIAVAKVIREFELVPVTRPSDIRFKPDLVLRNDGPVFVTFVKRL